jgi:hypothetical protein
MGVVEEAAVGGEATAQLVRQAAAAVQLAARCARRHGARRPRAGIVRAAVVVGSAVINLALLVVMRYAGGSRSGSAQLLRRSAPRARPLPPVLATPTCRCIFYPFRCASRGRTRRWVATHCVRPPSPRAGLTLCIPPPQAIDAMSTKKRRDFEQKTVKQLAAALRADCHFVAVEPVSTARVPIVRTITGEAPARTGQRFLLGLLGLPGLPRFTRLPL